MFLSDGISYFGQKIKIGKLCVILPMADLKVSEWTFFPSKESRISFHRNWNCICLHALSRDIVSFELSSICKVMTLSKEMSRRKDDLRCVFEHQNQFRRITVLKIQFCYKINGGTLAKTATSSILASLSSECFVDSGTAISIDY